MLRVFLGNINTYGKGIEFKFFLISIFLLASAPSLSLLFLLYSIIISLRGNFKNLINDKSNYILLVAALIMISKSIFASLLSTNEIANWEPILNWVGLGNWLPQFLIYFGAQIYVQNAAQRTLVAKILILGTVPVIFSCFTQYFLGWYGPYELFNGLIIWYQKVRTEINQPITGLFNNPNYAGAWIAMIWPFLLAYLYQKQKDKLKLKLFVVFTLCVFFIFAITLINSRGAWIGVFASIPFIFGKTVAVWFLPLVIIVIVLILLCTFPGIPLNIQTIFCLVIPSNILSNFSNYNLNFENISRFLIWDKAINLILDKPFFGWGAASFPSLYFSEYGDWKGHPHNLYLELSISYGLLTSLLVFTFIGIIIFNSAKNIYSKKVINNNFERAWLTSTFVFLILHSFDIVYFDMRISIIFWILLSGLRFQVNEPKNLESKIIAK